MLPLLLISQDYQSNEYIREINQILEKYVSTSYTFGIKTTVVYSLKFNNSELVIKQETLSDEELETKDYMVPITDIKAQNVIVSFEHYLINIKYGNLGTDKKYFKYLLFSYDGNREGLESEINIYLSDVSNDELEILTSRLRDLFSSISGIDYSDAQSSKSDYNYDDEVEEYEYDSEYYNENNDNNNYDYYSDYQNNDNKSNHYYDSENLREAEFEYYNKQGMRVYQESDAYYYRYVTYDEEGSLIVADSYNSTTPFQGGYLKTRDPNNINNDVRDGEWYWFYENGDVKYYAIYDNGQLANNEYIEFDEQGSPTLVFSDEFNNNSKSWRLGNEVDIYAGIESGFLFVESKNNYKIHSLIKYQIDQNIDFIIESKFKLLHGDNNSGQGIIWGFKNWDNYFSFRISDDGYYEIVAIKDGIRFELSKKWIKCDFVRKNKDWNKLQLNKYGEEMLFSINGNVVEKHDFYSFSGNYIGFLVGPNRKIKIDNLTVRQKLEINTEDSYGSGKRNETNNDSDIRNTGSGIVLSKDGTIITNYHVISGANSIGVAFYRNNERITYNAKYISGDKEHDLAIIKIDDINFIEFYEIPFNLKISDSFIGERVFTLGYPFASYMAAEIIFNEGTISSTTGLGGDDSHYQISVPVQPGNSGGPLFDLKGNLVGIVDSRTEELDNSHAENIAYAIKTYYVKRLIDKLPSNINIPNSNTTKYIETTDKVKILKEFVPIILVK